MQFLRFLIVGITATGAHYAVLKLTISYAQPTYSASANICASIVGISIAFIGNRTFTFRSSGIVTQEIRAFIILYIVAALVHTGVIFLLADWGSVSVNIAFLVATTVQILLTFLGNKHLVFKSSNR